MTVSRPGAAWAFLSALFWLKVADGVQCLGQRLLAIYLNSRVIRGPSMIGGCRMSTVGCAYDARTACTVCVWCACGARAVRVRCACSARGVRGARAVRARCAPGVRTARVQCTPTLRARTERANRTQILCGKSVRQNRCACDVRTVCGQAVCARASRA